jgi:hypothetical protein
MRLIQASFFAIFPLAFAAPVSDSVHDVHGNLEARQYGGGNGGGNDDPYSGAHRWIPANQINGASRTSCPYLNTVANHGFL